MCFPWICLLLFVSLHWFFAYHLVENLNLLNRKYCIFWHTKLQVMPAFLDFDYSNSFIKCNEFCVSFLQTNIRIGICAFGRCLIHMRFQSCPIRFSRLQQMALFVWNMQRKDKIAMKMILFFFSTAFIFTKVRKMWKTLKRANTKAQVFGHIFDFCEMKYRSGHLQTINDIDFTDQWNQHLWLV